MYAVISIQLPELTDSPLFTSCLINTLLLSEAELPFHSSPFYISFSTLLRGLLVEAGPAISLRFFFPFPPLSRRVPEGGSSFLLSATCRSQRPFPFQVKATFLPFSNSCLVDRGARRYRLLSPIIRSIQGRQWPVQKTATIPMKMANQLSVIDDRLGGWGKYIDEQKNPTIVAKCHHIL